MSTPFGTSLRRDPADPRGLRERIDAQLRERLEEAVEFACLDLLVQLRRQHGRPAPDAQSPKDRQEFTTLVGEFLHYLREAYRAQLSEADREKLAGAEAGSERLQGLLAVQVVLAKQLPDYWQRFEGFRAAFAQERLAAPPPKPGFLDRLQGR